MTKADKLKRAGALTILGLMKAMKYPADDLFGDSTQCGLCREYSKAFPSWSDNAADCTMCPIVLDFGRQCWHTRPYKTIEIKLHNEEDATPELQAAILWISEHTGAPIPTELK